MTATDGFTQIERSRKAVEHFVETGHSVDSIGLADRSQIPSAQTQIPVQDESGYTD